MLALTSIEVQHAQSIFFSMSSVAAILAIMENIRHIDSFVQKWTRRTSKLYWSMSHVSIFRQMIQGKLFELKELVRYTQEGLNFLSKEIKDDELQQ